LLTANSRHIGKIEKSSYHGRGLTEFNQIWHSDAVRPSTAVGPLKISNLKNARLRRPPSVEKSPYLGRGFTFFKGRTAQRVELRSPAKFGRHRSNRGRDMGIFRFFKMAAAAI